MSHSTSFLVAALVALVAVPSEAAPGFVSGEGIGSIYLEVNENPNLDISLVLPNFNLVYSSFGSVHEDGFDTSGIFDVDEILIGFDAYAYAFSAPMVPTLLSEVHGNGFFDRTVFATINNPTNTVQSVGGSISTNLSLLLSGERPSDLTSGSISYSVIGSGTGAGLPVLSYGHSDSLAPSPLGGSLRFDDFATFGFDLAPGEAYSFTLASFGASYFLRAAAVPEPASWALMILGFGMAGAALRRRGKAFAAITQTFPHRALRGPSRAPIGR